MRCSLKFTHFDEGTNDAEGGKSEVFERSSFGGRVQEGV